MSRFSLEGLPAPVNGILHIGAGTGGDLADWLEAGPRRLVLVEPDPDTVETLREVVAEAADAAADVARPEIEIVAAAAAPGPGETVQLHRFDFAEVNALRPATGLSQLFPGLAEQPSIPVSRCDPAELAGRLEAGDGRCNLLVIEAPGESLAILEALAEAECLGRFDRVVVQEGLESLYDGAATVDSVTAWLSGHGFTDLRRDPADPDRPHLRADRDPKVERIARLEADLAAATALAEAAEGEREAVRAERDTLAAARDKLIAERDALKARLEQDRQAAEARLRKAEAEHAEHRREYERQLTLLREEMTRARGQLEFIGEFLLKDAAS